MSNKNVYKVTAGGSVILTVLKVIINFASRALNYFSLSF